LRLLELLFTEENLPPPEPVDSAPESTNQPAEQ
jgi:hypothetical protein